MSQQQEIPNGRAEETPRLSKEDLVSLLFALAVAGIVAAISLPIVPGQDPLPEWLSRMRLAGPVAFFAWAKEYVPMLSRAWKRADRAEAALAEERKERNDERRNFLQLMLASQQRMEGSQQEMLALQRAEASQRAEDFRTMRAILEQIAANTKPVQPDQPDQSAPGPEG